MTATSAAGTATARGSVTIVRPPAPPTPLPQVTPTPTPAPFSARIAPGSPRLGALARSGLPVAVTCSAACTVTLRLQLGAADSRRLRLKRGVALGTARVQLIRAGTTTVRVGLTGAARRALSRSRPARLKLAVSATEAAKRPVAGARALTLRR
ncbi:hypothetical protein [Solirubrobacter soli]|uniref:hypothetical protein n=1 Tax=Solirubrobacter soli TaxID=363832 RepID=UPI00041CB347|nr:hypothetical protein [Solirubrobacter soli]